MSSDFDFDALCDELENCSVHMSNSIDHYQAAPDLGVQVYCSGIYLSQY